jgi:hypothetical protein
MLVLNPPNSISLCVHNYLYDQPCRESIVLMVWLIIEPLCSKIMLVLNFTQALCVFKNLYDHYVKRALLHWYGWSNSHYVVKSNQYLVSTRISLVVYNNLYDQPCQESIDFMLWLIIEQLFSYVMLVFDPPDSVYVHDYLYDQPCQESIVLMVWLIIKSLWSNVMLVLNPPDPLPVYTIISMIRHIKRALL